MKTLMIIFCLSLTSLALAEEVSTDCLAMDEETRAKIIKEKKPDTKEISGSSSQ